MSGPKFVLFLKDSKLLTRKCDPRNDLPETAAREIFMNCQMEEEEPGRADTGGGDDQMIYMEFVEAMCGVASYKVVNPYVPLDARLKETLEERAFPAMKQLFRKLAKKKKKKKKKKRKMKE